MSQICPVSFAAKVQDNKRSLLKVPFQESLDLPTDRSNSAEEPVLHWLDNLDWNAWGSMEFWFILSLLICLVLFRLK